MSTHLEQKPHVQVIAYEPKPSGKIWENTPYTKTPIREVLQDSDIEGFLSRTEGCPLEGRVMAPESWEISGLTRQVDFITTFIDAHESGECPCTGEAS